LSQLIIKPWEETLIVLPTCGGALQEKNEDKYRGIIYIRDSTYRKYRS